MTNMKDKLTDMWWNGPLRNDFVNTYCEIRQKVVWGLSPYPHSGQRRDSMSDPYVDTPYVPTVGTPSEHIFLCPAEFLTASYSILA